MEGQSMSVTFGKKRVFSRGIGSVSFCCYWYICYFLECSKYTYQQTKQEAVSVYIYSCSSIYFQHFCFAPEKSNSE